jgi:hypothetical protein
MNGENGWILVGQNGQGRANFSGGYVDTKIMSVGQDPSSTGTATQSGGTVRVQYAFIVGEASQNNNTYTMTGGTLDVGTSGSPFDSFGMWIGSGSGRGHMTVGTGATVISRNHVTVGLGVAGVAAGTLDVTGGSVLIPGPGTDGDLRIAIHAGASGALNLSAGTVSVGGTLQNAAAGLGTINISGGVLTSAAMESNGHYNQSGGTATVGAVTGLGSMTASAGRTTATSIRQSSIAVSGSGVIAVAPSGSALSVVQTVTSAGSGQLDLNDNDLIVTASNYANVSGQVATARAGGSWTGRGITSSAAKTASPAATTLGVMSGSEYLAVVGPTFGGETVAATDVLVKYTYYGDADFSGSVDFDDYVRADAGFNNGLSGWVNGDFDLSGGVDFDDYVLIDLGFNNQGGTLRRAQAYLDGSDRSVADMNTRALQKVVEHFNDFGTPYAANFLASVPEPSTLGLGAVAALGLLRRRRHA